jgi:hypothetical protein
MTRLTGSQAYELVEAYQSIYVPQELSEDQIMEDFENWVNDLVEEGYDLSDYTWDDMYEIYESNDNQLQESVDLYDVFISHLIDEGYANNVDDAIGIMANMSESWKNSIIQEILESE